MIKIKHKGLLIVAIIYVAAVFGLYSYLYLIPSISKSLSKTYIVESGTIEQSLDADALVVRNETVYYADASGSLSTYINESEKTRIGTKVADIYTNGNKHSLYCEDTGFISYYYDGLEESITPESVVFLDAEEILKIEDKSSNKKNSSVNVGDFVYKLVDGRSWYLLIPISENDLSSVRIGNTISIELEDGSVLKGLTQRLLGEDKLFLLVRVLSYYKDFCKIRILSTKVVTKSTEGLIIPNSSIAKEEGYPGVYVLRTDGKYHFVRVNVLDTKDDLSVISPDSFIYIEKGESSLVSTISMYDEILKDASKYNSK